MSARAHGALRGAPCDRDHRPALQLGPWAWDRARDVRTYVSSSMSDMSRVYVYLASRSSERELERARARARANYATTRPLTFLIGFLEAPGVKSHYRVCQEFHYSHEAKKRRSFPLYSLTAGVSPWLCENP